MYGLMQEPQAQSGSSVVTIKAKTVVKEFVCQVPVNVSEVSKLAAGDDLLLHKLSAKSMIR